jgi:hypothetical protein
MSVKILVLKSQEDVISDVSEIEDKGRVIGYNLKEPRTLNLSRVQNLNEEVDPNRVSVNFTKWQIFSNDAEYQIPADWVVTICEPMPRLKQSYEENVNAEERSMSNLSG